MATTPRWPASSSSSPPAGFGLAPWVLAAGSVFFIVLGLWQAAQYPRTSGEARAFERAPKCLGRGSVPPRCVEEVPGVVERRRARPREHDFVEVRVAERATFPPVSQPAVLEVPAPGHAFRSLERGDEVVVSYWGRRIAEVTKEGYSPIQTTESPTYRASGAVGLGLVLPVWGGCGL